MIRLLNKDDVRYISENAIKRFDEDKDELILSFRNETTIKFPFNGMHIGEYVVTEDSKGFYLGEWDTRNDGTRMLGSVNIVHLGSKNIYNGESCVSFSCEPYITMMVGLPVRFVSDKPMEGFADVGNGIYIAEKNYVDGAKAYFNYLEIIPIINRLNKWDELGDKKKDIEYSLKKTCDDQQNDTTKHRLLIMLELMQKLNAYGDELGKTTNTNVFESPSFKTAYELFNIAKKAFVKQCDWDVVDEYMFAAEKYNDEKYKVNVGDKTYYITSIEDLCDFLEEQGSLK